MLDDLRNSAQQSYSEDGVQREFSDENKVKTPRPQKKLFLGMTAAQRFVVSLLLLVMTCLGGMLCLLVTGSIALP